MNRRILGLGACAAAGGALALVLTPHGSAAPGSLASAGSDVPIWAFVVVGLALLLGLFFIVLGTRRRREDEDEVNAPTAEQPIAREPASGDVPAAPRGPDRPDLDRE